MRYKCTNVVILLSGMSVNRDDDVLALRKEAGMTEFIPKPFRIQKLLDVIDKYFGQA